MHTHLKRRILFGFIMGTLVSAVISFALTALSIGFPLEFVDIWLPQFARAWVLAVPLVFFAAPFVKRVVELLVPEGAHPAEHPYD